ncbi:MAG: HipA domain-containing protein [Thiogranum sp.]
MVCSWIVKLPSMKFEGVPENEFAIMTLARMIGMDVPDVELVDLEVVSGLPEGIGRLKGSALAVKRFDRTEEGGIIHSEDFAQVFGVYPERKYERASYRNIAEETVERFMATWSEEREHLPLSSHIIETIEQHLRKIELVREIAGA